MQLSSFISDHMDTDERANERAISAEDGTAFYSSASLSSVDFVLMEEEVNMMIADGQPSPPDDAGSSDGNLTDKLMEDVNAICSSASLRCQTTIADYTEQQMVAYTDLFRPLDPSPLSPPDSHVSNQVEFEVDNKAWTGVLMNESVHNNNKVWVKITLATGHVWSLPKEEHHIRSNETPTSFQAGSRVRVLCEGEYYLGTVLSCTYDKLATTREDQLDYTVAYKECGSTQKLVAHSTLTLGWE